MNMNLVEAVNKALGTNGTNLQGALNEAAGTDASNITEAISNIEGGGGGGGLDSLPVFTVTENGNNVSVTCNKTFDEVLAVGYDQWFTAPCYVDNITSNYGQWQEMRYTESSSDFSFGFISSQDVQWKVIFNSDGSITAYREA